VPPVAGGLEMSVYSYESLPEFSKSGTPKFSSLYLLLMWCGRSEIMGL
jgi:hypothetical protein